MVIKNLTYCNFFHHLRLGRGSALLTRKTVRLLTSDHPSGRRGTSSADMCGPECSPHSASEYERVLSSLHNIIGTTSTTSDCS